MEIKVQPYSESSACPKCGAEDMGQSGQFSPLSISTRYCPGGQEPESAEVTPAAALIEVLSKVAASGINFGPLKNRINICAGIGTEHLHKVCRNCQYEFLTETKDAALPAA